MSRETQPIAIWRWPLVLAAITAVGLLLGLFSGGGLGDMAGGVLLAVPVVVGLRFGWLRRAPRKPR